MTEGFTPEEFLRVYQPAAARWATQRAAMIERQAKGGALFSLEAHAWCMERELEARDERDYYLAELRKYTDAEHPPGAIREQYGVRWPEGDETAAVDEKHARMAIECSRGVLLRRVIGPWVEAV